MHHIVSDGWSMGVMIRELAVLYEAYREGKESPLEELEIQYADYAVWQRQWLRGEVLDRQLEYWSQAVRRSAATARPANGQASTSRADLQRVAARFGIPRR